MDLYPMYQVDFLRIRNEILRIYQQKIRKRQYILPEQKMYFEEIIVQNYFLEDQILAIWQNKKL